SDVCSSDLRIHLAGGFVVAQLQGFVVVGKLFGGFGDFTQGAAASCDGLIQFIKGGGHLALIASVPVQRVIQLFLFGGILDQLRGAIVQGLNIQFSRVFGVVQRFRQPVIQSFEASGLPCGGFDLVTNAVELCFQFGDLVSVQNFVQPAADRFAEIVLHGLDDVFVQQGADAVTGCGAADQCCAHQAESASACTNRFHAIQVADERTESLRTGQCG